MSKIVHFLFSISTCDYNAYCIRSRDRNLIPGKKMCPSCRSKVMKHLSKSMSENDEDFDIVSETSIQNKKEGVYTHFTVAGISPIRVKDCISQVKSKKVNKN